MKIQEILNQKGNVIISSIGPDVSIIDALDLLCANKIGALMVINSNGELIGIITERDVLWEIDQNPDKFRERKVSDIMSTDLICGLMDDDVNYVMNVMTQNKIRHLPVVSDNKVVGLISIGDVIKSLLDEKQIEIRRLHDYLHLKGEI